MANIIGSVIDGIFGAVGAVLGAGQPSGYALSAAARGGTVKHITLEAPLQNYRLVVNPTSVLITFRDDTRREFKDPGVVKFSMPMAVMSTFEVCGPGWCNGRHYDERTVLVDYRPAGVPGGGKGRVRVDQVKFGNVRSLVVTGGDLSDEKRDRNIFGDDALAPPTDLTATVMDPAAAAVEQARRVAEANRGLEDPTMLPWEKAQNIVESYVDFPIAEEIMGRGEIGAVDIGPFPNPQKWSDYFLGATQAIVERARDDKFPPPPSKVVAEHEPDYGDYEVDDDGSPDDPFGDAQVISFADWGGGEILGTMGADPAEAEAAFPTLSKLYKRFSGGAGDKYVRLDTPESYAKFRAALSPEMALLTQKVEELEAIVRNHMADGHGGQQVVDEYAAEITELRGLADPAAKRVPLSMPPDLEGTWDCWREGDLVCCTIALLWRAGLPGCDGEIRYCTSATPVAKHAIDVVGYAHDVGADPVALIGVLPTVACMMAGGSLMPAMAAAAPSLLAHPGAQGDAPFIGRIVPANHPTLASMIALLQQAQSGDPQAALEWRGLGVLGQREPSLAASMVEAERRLLAAQAKKAA